MAIISHTFGSVRLMQDDAVKFTNQIRHGKPKAAARESTAAGSALAKQLRENGGPWIKVSRPSRRSTRRWISAR